MTKTIEGKKVELKKIASGHYTLNGFHIVKIRYNHTYFNVVARKRVSSVKTVWGYSKNLAKVHSQNSLIEDTLNEAIEAIVS